MQHIEVYKIVYSQKGIKMPEKYEYDKKGNWQEIPGQGEFAPMNGRESQL